jgi:hypothetical protein
MTVSDWEYVLSDGDVKYGNISFTYSPLDVEDCFFGGTNKSESADQSLNVTFRPGSTSRQWLYGDKKIFANRNPHTKDFFAAIGAREGTTIRITQTSRSALLIEKV